MKGPNVKRHSWKKLVLAWIKKYVLRVQSPSALALYGKCYELDQLREMEEENEKA